jgi:hypothetical protein
MLKSGDIESLVRFKSSGPDGPTDHKQTENLLIRLNRYIFNFSWFLSLLFF